MAGRSISRERSPVAILLDPARDIPLGERDIRVEDFLNDKIQTIFDLEDLESLIASVETQKQQLEEQVRIPSNHLTHVELGLLTKHSSNMRNPNCSRPRRPLLIAHL